MDGNHKAYDFSGRLPDAIDEILAQPSGGTSRRRDSLPDRDRLTFTNGFYSILHSIVRRHPRLLRTAEQVQATSTPSKDLSGLHLGGCRDP